VSDRRGKRIAAIGLDDITNFTEEEAGLYNNAACSLKSNRKPALGLFSPANSS